MYREKGNLDNTIELYEKILDIEEDETIRAELDDVKYEKESVEKTMEFLDLLKDINLIIPSGLRVTEEEMREIFMDLNKALESFQKIDDDKDTEIAQYIKEIREMGEYKALVGTVETGSGPYYDNILMAMGRNNLLQQLPDILNVDFPPKYK
jgi:cell fate (sporulation/competence/biofilm development) regulator YlbF (YheA/YmcA/DUF963 family)